MKSRSVTGSLSMMVTACVVLYLLSAAASNAHAKRTSSDEYGFFGIDQNEPGGPVYQFIFINTNGLKVAGPGDDISSASPVVDGGIGSAVQLAEPFFYYGEEYYTLTPSSNGYISTDPSDLGDDYNNDPTLPTAPSTGGGARIYPLHDDLVISPSGGLYYAYFLSSPHPHGLIGGGCHVFQWDNVYRFGGASDRIFDFEVLLFDNGDILYQYGLSLDPKADSATIGIQNTSATDATLYAANDPTALPPIPSGSSFYPGFAVLFRAPVLVTNLSDSIPAPPGSLRRAMELVPNDGKIRFAPSVDSGGDIQLVHQLEVTGKTISITAADRAGEIRLLGAPGKRLFTVDGSSNLRLEDLRLSGGHAEGASFPDNAGGAILNYGDLNVNGVTIDGCNASGDGGAICGAAGAGNIQIGNSEIAGCTAGARGGGIFTTAPLAAFGVTISNCDAGQDGGGVFELYLGSSQSQILSSTVRNCRATSRGGGIYTGGGEIVMTKSALVDCAAGQDGGGIYIPGSSTHQVAFNQGRITGCVAENGQGGGMFNGAIASLQGVQISANRAGTDGGGIFNINELALRYASLYDNTASRGGGAFNAGFSTAELINATIAENTALTDGAGAFNGHGGNLRLISTTVARNEARSRGGGIRSDGALFLAGALVADNQAGLGGPDLFGSISIRDGTNLIGDSSGASGLSATDLRDLDAKLGPLSDYGGASSYPTIGQVAHWRGFLSVPLLAGSPAIDASPDLTALSLAVDQRGFPRLANGDGQPSSTEMDIGAWEGSPPIFVTTTADELDPPGAGGATSLREAIRDSAASGARILFAPAQFSGPAPKEILLSNGPMTFGGKTTIIDATGSAGVTLDGSASAEIIRFSGDSYLGLFGVSFESARVVAVTAAIDHGALTAFRCRFSSNGTDPSGLPASRGSAISAPYPENVLFTDSQIAGRVVRLFDCQFISNGKEASSLRAEGCTTRLEGCVFDRNLGGISVFGGGAVSLYFGQSEIDRCSFAENQAARGGAVSISQGSLIISESTFSGNTAAGFPPEGGSLAQGGAILAYQCGLQIKSSTLSSNRAIATGGALYAVGVAASVSNSILAGNSAPANPDIYSGDGIVAGAPNLIGGDPKLASLGYYGGAVPTMPPLAGSPALDAGAPLVDLPLTDQRGFPRLVGQAPDIGAVEPGPVRVVDTKDDVTNAGDGKLSLREAIAAATEPGARVQFEPAVFSGQSTENTILVDPALGRMDITGRSVTIDASNISGRVAISGGRASGLFGIVNSTASFHGLDICNAKGGAIRCWNSEFTADRCDLIDNRISEPIPFPQLAHNHGGALYCESTRCQLVLSRIARNFAEESGGAVFTDGEFNATDCHFQNNRATERGGAIFCRSERQANVRVARCTFQGNLAILEGGAIYCDGSRFEATATTLYGNESACGGGLFSAPTPNRAPTLSHCTVSGNEGSGVAGFTVLLENSIVSGNYANGVLSDIATSFIFVRGNNLYSDPKLAPLGDYGGPTPTMPPLPESPAIDAATSSPSSFDQRGMSRIGPRDIGAAEYQGIPDRTRFWNQDWDDDGSVYGVEHALGTDPFVKDVSHHAIPRLTAEANGDRSITFGFNTAAATDTIWIVTRSTDLNVFNEIYRFDGPTRSEVLAAGIESIFVPVLMPNRINIIDHSPPSPRAFYRFEANIALP